ncbi:MAG: LytR C-terminal domain-containing protein [Patescibacteria group bacterium]
MPETEKRVVVYLTTDHLRLVWVELGPDGPRVVKKTQKEFTPESLVKVLLRIKRGLGKVPVRWLLDESQVYLKLIRFPLKTKINRDLVLEKAQEAIPEFLDEDFFDWRLGKADSSYQTVQFLAVSKKYFDFVYQSFKKAGIPVETFEPVAFALARLLPDSQPRLLVHQGEKLVLVAVQGGQVLESRVLDVGLDIDKEVEQMVEFVKDKWGVKLKRADDLSLDPFLGLALKKMDIAKENLDLSSPDVVIGETPTVTTETIETVGEETSKSEPIQKMPTAGSDGGDKKKKIILIIVGIGLGLLLVLLLGKAIAGRTEKLDEFAEPTPVPTEAPSPTPTPDRSGIKLKVLNGSGVPGLAGEAKDILEGLGYLDVAVGNANSYDYTETEIAVKEDGQEYFELLLTDLSGDYSVASQSSVLDEDSQYDAVVTLGKNGGDEDVDADTDAVEEEEPVEEVADEITPVLEE